MFLIGDRNTIYGFAKAFTAVLAAALIFFVSAYVYAYDEEAADPLDYNISESIDEIFGMGFDTDFNNNVEKFGTGGFSFNITALINDLAEDFFYEISSSGEYLIMFIIIAAFSSVLSVMQSAVKNRQTADTAFFACFTLMSGIVVRVITLAMDYARDVIEQMTVFITKLSPLMAGLMVASGKISSASVFRPVLSAAVYVISILCEKCIVPLICFGAVLSIVNNLGGKTQISNFTALIKSTTRWILTGILTIFTGLTAIYGFTAPGLDVLSAKTVKFAVGSLVPVVGGLLSDAVDTVVGSSVIMKNAVGTAGVIAIAGMCIVPVIKIAAIVFMLRLSAATTEPLSDKRISGLLSDGADVINIILGMVITVSVMFIINISIMIAATNSV
ncbi:MAG: stage III sporulation protein AE [Oscillospiraceae bacterium]|nr:stage III sporulation protein AE [Oscillospiraceae bacterium]